MLLKIPTCKKSISRRHPSSSPDLLHSDKPPTQLTHLDQQSRRLRYAQISCSTLDELFLQPRPAFLPKRKPIADSPGAFPAFPLQPQPRQQRKPNLFAVQTTETRLSTAEAVPIGAFNCDGQPDGDYSKGCSNIYYSCRGSQAIERQCPMTSLKFDQPTKKCLMSDWVAECGGTATTVAPFVVADGPIVEKDPRCDGLPDGIFEMPGASCSEHFLACTDGYGQEMACADPGTKFDVETAKCLGAMYVKACGGKPTPAPVQKPRDPVDPIFSCAGKADGDHPHPKEKCSFQYYSCTGGVAEVRECAEASLRFDSQQGVCEEAEFNYDCGGSVRLAEETTTHKPDVTETEFSCKGQPDGMYDDHYGCSAVFYACSGGIAAKFQCSGSLVFDSDSKRCLAQNYVKACGGAPTPIPTIVDDVGTPLPPPEVDFDCASAGEGLHSQGCSNQFIICSFGRPYLQTCSSSGLRFDPDTRQCIGETFVQECGGKPTPAPEPQPLFNPPPSVDFQCEGKTDGQYPDQWEPCSPHFFSCASGSAAKIPCPNGLQYDHDSKMCLNEAFITACSGQPTPKPSPKPQPVPSDPIDVSPYRRRRPVNANPPAAPAPVKTFTPFIRQRTLSRFQPIDAPAKTQYSFFATSPTNALPLPFQSQKAAASPGLRRISVKSESR